MHLAGRCGQTSCLCLASRFRNCIYGENGVAAQSRFRARTFANQHKQHRSKKSNNNTSPRELNGKIMELGRQKKWEDLLQVYQKEKKQFNAVNYSTIMSQLARIRQLDNRNASLLELLNDLPQQLKHFKARNIGTTANALAKMRIPKQKRYLTVEFFAALDNAVSYTHLTLPTIYSV